MMTLYGISNCSTVKKAKDWLQANHIDYQFHDYRQQGLSADLLEKMETELGWETMLNKRSTSWRQLNEEQQKTISKQTALQYMLQTPTLIKRPILNTGEKMIVGFTAEKYQEQL